MSENTKKSMISGAAILAAAGLFVKFLGAFFRIPLGNLIGTVGMANYTPAYSLYNFLLVFSTTGLPVAVSKMVSERRAVGQYVEAEKVFKLSRTLMLLIGIAGCIFVYLFADWIAQTVHVPGSALSMKATAPALILVPLMASYRGYFQGMQEMSPTAISQIVEQIFRVVIGLTLAIVLMNGAWFAGFTPQERGAAGGCFGASAGAFGGLLAVLFVYFRKRSRVKSEIRADREAICERAAPLLKKILWIAVPITIGTAIMPIVNLVDAGVVSTRLVASGWDSLESQDLYGQLTGFASPLVGFPQILTQAVVLSLVPMVSAAFKRQDTEELHSSLSLGFRMSMIIGIPCATGLFVLAGPILMLLYPTQKESAIHAAPCLQILAIGFVFLSIVLTITGGLQGITKQMVPVINLFLGVVIKFIITWSLVAVPAINVLGAAIGTVCAYAFAGIMDTIMLIRFTKVRFPWKLIFIKPLISALIMGVVTIVIYKIVFAALASNTIATGLAILVAVPLYGVLIIKTKAIRRDEMMTLSIGRKIARICDRLRLW